MRSLLFVPGDAPDKLAKSLKSGSDALIIDLEDSVAPARKQEARRITSDFLTMHHRMPQTPRIYVRINPLNGDMWEADLDAMIVHAPHGIVLPKACGGQDIMLLSARIAAREAELQLENGTIRIIAIATETAASLFHMGSYAGASQRLEGLAWGGEDLSASIGAESNRRTDGAYADPYRLARSLTLLGAAAAGAQAIDSVYTAFRDLDGLRAEAEAARIDGFSCKMAIHPAQVPVINEVFTPSEEAIDRARRVIAAFEGAGDVGVVGIDDEMLDRPHLLRAQRILTRARAAGIEA